MYNVNASCLNPLHFTTRHVWTTMYSGSELEISQNHTAMLSTPYTKLNAMFAKVYC